MNKEIAIVTGATKGIGAAIAKQCILDGYFVIGTYVRDYDASVIAEMENENFKLFQVDSSNFEACEQFARQVKSYDIPLGLLVNNAGITKDALMMRMNADMFKAVIDTNLIGVFNMTQAFTKQLLKQRQGSIINMSSVVGVSGNIGQANYAASKAGVIGFSKSIAREFASRNIRVNCIAPGFIETEMTDAVPDVSKEQILNQIALGRMGSVEDIAHAVSYLAKANYITGQTLQVCGGMVI